MLVSWALSGLSLFTTVLAQSSSVDTYVASESPIAKAGLLANIGPNGAKSSGAKVCFYRGLSTTPQL